MPLESSIPPASARICRGNAPQFARACQAYGRGPSPRKNGQGRTAAPLREPSERYVRSEADHQLVLDFLRRVVRIHDPTARIEDILDVGLNLPPRHYLILIGCFEKGLVGPYGGKDAGTIEGCVLVEPGRAVADPDDAHGEARGVVLAPLQRIAHREAGAEFEADEIAILQRREHRTHEDVDVAIGISSAPDHLVGDRVERVVAAMTCGSLIVRGIA